MEDKKLELGRQILQGKNNKLVKQIDLSDIHKDWVGTFVFHYPSLMEQVQIGVMKAKMLDGVPVNSVDTLTDNIAFMTATLHVVMDSAPEWFNLDKLDDFTALFRVYNEFAQWRESFRQTNNENADKGNSEAS